MTDKASLIDELQTIKWVIDEWERVDRTGMAFRYCVDKKAKDVLLTAQDVVGFDLKHLAPIMDETLEELGRIAAATFSPNDFQEWDEYKRLQADITADALQREVQ